MGGVVCAFHGFFFASCISDLVQTRNVTILIFIIHLNKTTTMHSRYVPSVNTTVLWAIHATPIKERREFINNNTFSFSAVYSLGSANFLLVNVAVITGLLSHARRQPNENSIYVAIAGLLLGLLLEFVFLYAAGLVTVQAMRPWKIAYNRLVEKKRTTNSDENQNEKPIGESESVTLSTSFYDRPHHGAPRNSGPPIFVTHNGRWKIENAVLYQRITSNSGSQPEVPSN
mmetsp:Transcript_17662/g.42999  ORF Transcript_17662/g.42999 Transcript_17662/m.42999 type:complete len:229 (+) Transcript_17662:3235-3921(+)